MRFFGRIAAWISVGFGCLIVVLAAGCSSMGDSAAHSTPIAEAAATGAAAPVLMTSDTDLLRPNDLVVVIFSGIPNAPDRHEERIKEDGTIKLQLLEQPVAAAGKTPGQLQKEIPELYLRNNIFKRLTVTVLTENRFFFVMGEVKAPGRYVYSGETTVLKAISTASDFTDFAKKTRVELMRLNGQKFTINAQKARKNMNLDLPVIPGDKVYVPRRIW